MRVSKNPIFAKTELSDLITSMAVVLLADNGTVVRPVGTAVFVARELAMTARHVIEEFWNTFEARPRPDDGIPVDCHFRILALQFLGSPSRPALWYLTRGWCAQYTDVAFLELRPADDAARNHDWAVLPRLSLLPPGVGEQV